MRKRVSVCGNVVAVGKNFLKDFKSDGAVKAVVNPLRIVAGEVGLWGKIGGLNYAGHSNELPILVNETTVDAEKVGELELRRNALGLIPARDFENEKVVAAAKHVEVVIAPKYELGWEMILQ